MYILPLLQDWESRIKLFHFQIVCMGKYSVAMVENEKFMNPVICIVAAAFFSHVLLNILIYQKRRKNEKQDKNCKINKQFNNRVPKSLWSLLINFIQLALTLSVSIINTTLLR